MGGTVRRLAASLTSFVGRAGAVEEVSGLLGTSRLVTVTGPGGVGKTRLAVEVARQLGGRFADGLCLVELAAVTEPALVPAAVTAALGLPQSPDLSAADSLAAALARLQVLLVLDNCEHIIESAADLCEMALHAGDDTRILATSQEPLRVAGEARYRLPPLSVPPPGEQGGNGQSDAVSLFTDRAKRIDPHFELTPEWAPVVGRLVARLDGMPLAMDHSNQFNRWSPRLPCRAGSPVTPREVFHYEENRVISSSERRHDPARPCSKQNRQSLGRVGGSSQSDPSQTR